MRGGQTAAERLPLLRNGVVHGFVAFATFVVFVVDVVVSAIMAVDASVTCDDSSMGPGCEEWMMSDSQYAVPLFLVGFTALLSAVLVNRRLPVRLWVNTALAAVAVGGHLAGFWLIAAMPTPPA